MAINHTRELADLEGATLEGWYKGKRTAARVERGRRGELRVRVKNQRFPSLSAAGEAVTGGVSCNGWRFWSLVEQPVVKKTRARRAA